MGSSSRMFLLATALLTSGVSQFALAVGDDACCSGEKGGADEKRGSCPDCPPGLVCSCCPVRGAVQAFAPEVAPAASRGEAVPTYVMEPNLIASAADIFHPPRA